jgi:hypothetical protein
MVVFLTLAYIALEWWAYGPSSFGLVLLLVRIDA